MTARRLRVLLSSVALLCGACGAEDDLYVTWSGEYIDYRWHVDYHPCGGTPGYLDGFVVHAATILRIDPGLLPRLDYSWMTTADFAEVDATQPFDIIGFASGRSASSTTPLSLHEVVHLLDVQAWSEEEDSLFLREGLAVALERSFHSPPSGGDPRPFLVPPEGSPVAYPIAGAFVLYLLGRYGVGPLFSFRRQYSLTGREGEGFDDAFYATYGVTVDEALHDMLDDDFCPSLPEPVPKPYHCTMPLLPEVPGSGWRYAREMSCDDDDDDDVAGGFGGLDSLALQAFTVDIPTDGLFRLSVVGDAAEVWLTTCEECVWNSRRSILALPDRDYTANLKAGIYALTLVVREPGPREIGVLLTRESDILPPAGG